MPNMNVHYSGNKKTWLQPITATSVLDALQMDAGTSSSTFDSSVGTLESQLSPRSDISKSTSNTSNSSKGTIF